MNEMKIDALRHRLAITLISIDNEIEVLKRISKKLDEAFEQKED